MPRLRVKDGSPKGGDGFGSVRSTTAWPEPAGEGTPKDYRLK